MLEVIARPGLKTCYFCNGFVKTTVRQKSDGTFVPVCDKHLQIELNKWK
jgi:hypothetical protein